MLCGGFTKIGIVLCAFKNVGMQIDSHIFYTFICLFFIFSGSDGIRHNIILGW